MNDDRPLGSQRQSRRRFISTVAAGAAALSQNIASHSRAADGANERIGIGFLGVGNRGQTHVQIVQALNAKGLAQAVAVCDAYLPRAREAAKATGAKIYTNYQELLADPAVDAVCIATPDRHHAPQAIEAVRCGKDVYLEKPITHWSQPDLAMQLAREAAKYERIVQVGTQFVSDEAYEQVSAQIRGGTVGKVVHVQGGYFRRGDWGERMPIPDPNAQPGPDLMWEQFLGDAPQVPYSVSRFFQWRMYWDYAGGPATDLLVHAFTPILRVLNLDYPARVSCGGGTFQYNREVPDQCNIMIDYEGGPSIVLMNSLSNHATIDTMLRGTAGTITWKQINDNNSKEVRISPHSTGVQEIVIPWTNMGNTQGLWENFLDCIKTRKEPVSPMSLAIKVQLPLTMAILAHRNSKVVTFDRESEQIVA